MIEVEKEMTVFHESWRCITPIFAQATGLLPYKASYHMVILITGASRGIGFAIAEAFAQDPQQHHLIMVSQNAAKLAASAADLQTRFPQNTVLHYACNLADKAAIATLSEWLHTQVDAVDVLVNNAGYFLPGSVHNEPEGTLEEMLQTNLLSAYHLTRAALPRMMARKSGHVFNLCSIASLQAYANGGSYSISKFALLGFGQNLREEMKPYHIKVTNIMPGAVYTDSWAGSGVQKERIMEAADVAKMVYTAAHLSPQACVEDIVMRPVLGDL
jgi:short-subunit dehydrogenase